MSDRINVGGACGGGGGALATNEEAPETAVRERAVTTESARVRVGVWVGAGASGVAPVPAGIAGNGGDGRAI